MTEKLKRCPFCGNEAEFNSDEFGEGVCCKSCGATMHNGVYGEEGRRLASAAWNTRPIENELREKIEKLEAENKRLREALEFYAELDGNGIQLYGDMDSKALEFVDGDSQIFGTIAKDALKGNENG